MAAAALHKREQNRYTGEKRNELRHGHGIYRYPNKFFRYEGEWKDGEKHGHGKLILGDSGYYEGTFEHGEIEGHGFKVFGVSGATYTGQFHLGELHGQGLMRKTDGELYEGSWSHNSREGRGILTGADGSSYEGEFHNNLKHGEGLQVYSNGDHYEGDWVAGKRHGHGMLRCMDGTIYDGQWRNDFYHGEGSISHASGITYSGMWYNGLPASNAVSLKMLDVDVSKGIVVEQGKTFSIKFECLDQNGRVCKNESGRSFKVAVSKKKSNVVNKFRSRVKAVMAQRAPLDKNKSPTRIIILPNSVSIVAQEYELLQIPSSDDSSNPSHMVSTANEMKPMTDGAEPSTAQKTGSTVNIMVNQLDSSKAATVDVPPNSSRPHSSKGKPQESISTAHSNISLEQGSTTSLGSPKKRKKLLVRELNSCETQSVIFSTDDNRKEFGSSDQQFLDSLVQPGVITTKNGTVSCKDLFLPPAPAQDISHLLSVSKRAGSESPTEKSISSSPSGSKLRPKGGTASSSPVESASPQGKKKVVKTELQTSKNPAKEKLLQPRRDKHCAPGQYYLTIQEVSNPPYFGHPLQLHVELMVVPIKHEKEVNMDRLLKSRASKDPADRAKSRLMKS